MGESHKRTKDPVAVKEALINASISLALEGGISAVTTQSVCRIAGVSKGALNHHYLNKQVLLESVFDYLLQTFEAEVLNVLSEYEGNNAAFTKSYVDICLKILEDETYRPLAALSTLLVSDESCRQRWQTWLRDMINQYEATGDNLQCQLARFAVDGVWYNSLINNAPVDFQNIKVEILNNLN